MQQKERCVEKLIELKSVTAVRRWYIKNMNIHHPLQIFCAIGVRNLKYAGRRATEPNLFVLV